MNWRASLAQHKAAQEKAAREAALEEKPELSPKPFSPSVSRPSDNEPAGAPLPLSKGEKARRRAARAMLKRYARLRKDLQEE